MGVTIGVIVGYVMGTKSGDRGSVGLRELGDCAASDRMTCR